MVIFITETSVGCESFTESLLELCFILPLMTMQLRRYALFITYAANHS